jgi:hypothetical protein
MATGVVHAQEPIRAGGTIVIAGPVDSMPLPGVTVVLHRVGRDVQGPVDSTAADQAGRFRVAFAHDSAAVYLFSASYAGIQYFSTPIHTNPSRHDTTMVIAVSDTTSVALVEVSARHVVLGTPGTDGTRDVVDLVGLNNPGWSTRIAGEAQRPTWNTPLDERMVGFHLGSSDFSPEAVFFSEGRVEVFGPIAPGEKSLLLKYRVPQGMKRWHLVFADTVFDFSVLVEDDGPVVTGPVREASAPQVIGGRSFRTFRGRPAPGDTVSIAFTGVVGPDSRVALIALVLLLSAALLSSVVAWRRRQAPATVARKDESVEVLVRRLALLDAKRAGGSADAGAEALRAELKAQLARALARAGRP